MSGFVVVHSFCSSSKKYVCVPNFVFGPTVCVLPNLLVVHFYFKVYTSGGSTISLQKLTRYYGTLQYYFFVDMALITSYVSLPLVTSQFTLDTG